MTSIQSQLSIAIPVAIPSNGSVSMANGDGTAPPALLSHNQQVKTGRLLRRGFVLKQWKFRFYILRDQFLFYCKKTPATIEVYCILRTVRVGGAGQSRGQAHLACLHCKWKFDLSSST